MAFTQAYGTFFDAALKQLYKSENVEDLTLKDNVLYGLLPKQGGMGGRNTPLVALYGNTQAIGNVLSDVQTASDVASPESVTDFLMTRVRRYGVVRLEQEGIEATQGDKMAFLQLLKTRVDGIFQSMANRLETELFRHHHGAVAQISACTDADPSVATLTQPEEISNFELGQQVTAGSTQAMTTLRNAVNGTAGSIATLSAINRGTGTFSFVCTGGNTDFVANDWIGYATTASGTVSGVGGATHALGPCPSGLAAWIPAAAPGTNAWEEALFFGVADRSVDGRLYGQVHDGSAEPLEEALIKAQSKAAREGGAPSVALMINAQYRRLILQLGSKRVVSQVQAQASGAPSYRIGYRSVQVEGDAGVIDVVAARRCQATTAWLINPSDWALMHLGEPIGFIPYKDGLQMLRLASDDGVEGRIAFRGNLACRAPGRQIRVTLATP